MSNSKNYNSIVFLTTLSVYLGLVLIGAPPILAQAALARQFDIQNEIEVKDDLDEKPDGEEIENLSNEDFPFLFIQLIDKIKKEVGNGKISLPIQTNFYVELLSESSEKSGGEISVSSNLSGLTLNDIIQSEINGKIQIKAIELADYKGKFKNVKIRFEGNNNDLTLRVSFSKSKAKQFAEFLNEDFFSSATLAKNVLIKQTYNNTKVSSENNQVFVVTRLPRGSLDEFLAQKDAQ